MRDKIITVLVALFIIVLYFYQFDINFISISLAVVFVSFTIFFTIISVRFFILFNNSESESKRLLNDVNQYKQFMIDNAIQFKENPTREDKIKELEIYIKFLKEYPENEYGMLHKAHLHFDLGEYDDAMKLFEILATTHKDEILYLIEYAKCYYVTEHKEKALEILDNFYKKKKKDTYYYQGLGIMHESAKEYDDALENYTKAINLEPDCSSNYLYRANVYKAMKNRYAYEADMDKFNELEEQFDRKCRLIDEKLQEKNDNNKSDIKDKDLGTNGSKSLKP